MVEKYFWMYIGSFLLCSIALASVVKKFADGFETSGKRPFLYGALSSVIASVTAFASTLLTNDYFKSFWFLGGVFLVFGIVHLIIVHQKYFYAHRHNANKVLVGELIFGLSIIFFTIVVFSSLQYYIKDKFFPFYPMLMSFLLFFVPLLLFQTFEAAYGIPPAEYKTWQYPLHDPIELPDDDLNEKLLVIGFEIAKHPNDSNKTYFRAKAPETMKLGDLYYHFINDYNDLHSETTIQYADNDYEAHEWWFRRKPKWYQGQLILNPDFSVRENGIQENTVIICERISNYIQ